MDNKGKLQLIIVFSLLLRVILAFHTRGIARGDEHEYLSMANQLTGGRIDYLLGFRSYAYPLIVAVPFALSKILGVISPDMIITAARLLNVVASTFLVYITYLLGRRLYDENVGLLAAFFVGFSWFITAWTLRVMTEALASTFILFSFYLILEEKELRSGLLIGAATMLHMKYAIFIIPLLAFLTVKRRHALKSFAVGWLMLFLVQGFVDYLTYGEWFHSVIEYFFRTQILEYARLIIESGGISGVYALHESLYPGHGTSPLYQYMGIIPTIIALPLILFVVLTLKTESKTLLASTIAFVLLVLSFMPHKEDRLLFPIVPLLYILAAFGFFWIYKRVENSKACKAILVFSIIAVFSSNMFMLQYLPYRAHYNEAEAMRWIGRQENAVGVFSYYHPPNSGGYMYIQKNIPVYYSEFKNISEVGSEINYVVIPDYQADDLLSIIYENFRAVKTFETDYPNEILMETAEQDILVYERIV
ncbi:MAG: glycosyltransferase family 39 protein [Candidatus Altiarchaeota archaeon]